MTTAVTNTTVRLPERGDMELTLESVFHDYPETNRFFPLVLDWAGSELTLQELVEMFQMSFCEWVPKAPREAVDGPFKRLVFAFVEDEQLKAEALRCMVSRKG